MNSVEVPAFADGQVTRFLDGSERSVVALGTTWLGRGTYQPGWRWSEHAAPLHGNQSEAHVGYVVSGQMAIRGADGSQHLIGPGEAWFSEPNYDAWVEGHTPCVSLDFPVFPSTSRQGAEPLVATGMTVRKCRWALLSAQLWSLSDARANGVGDEGDQSVRRYGLLDEGEYLPASPHCLNVVVVGAHQEYRRGVVKSIEDSEAIEDRHPCIEGDRNHVMSVQHLQRYEAIGGLNDFVPGDTKDSDKRRADPFVVVHDQDRAGTPLSIACGRPRGRGTDAGNLVPPSDGSEEGVEPAPGD